jgi:hypothetical protein
VIGSLRGENLCNALMKAVTKAKRRATLSFCGLGDVIDESELETVRDVRRVAEAEELPPPDAHHAKHHNNDTGHGSGAYAKPHDVDAFQEWVRIQAETINDKWVDKHTGRDGEVEAGVKDELISRYQLANHLYKWARSTGLVQAPDEIRPGQRDKFTAVAWVRDRTEIEAEALRYSREKWREAKAKLAQSKAAEPDPMEDIIEDAHEEREPGCDDE